MIQKLISLLKERMPFRYYPVWIICGASWFLINFAYIAGINVIANDHPGVPVDIPVFLLVVAQILILVLAALPIIDVAQRVWFGIKLWYNTGWLLAEPGVKK